MLGITYHNKNRKLQSKASKYDELNTNAFGSFFLKNHASKLLNYHLIQQLKLI